MSMVGFDQRQGVSPRPKKGTKTHETKRVFRTFNQHVWAYYPKGGWTYLDPAAIVGWIDLLFGRIRASQAEVLRKFALKDVTFLEPWVIVESILPKFERARTYEDDVFFTRWWADHLIEWVGHQLYNHVWSETFKTVQDTRVADKAARDYLAQFEAQFV